MVKLRSFRGCMDPHANGRWAYWRGRQGKFCRFEKSRRKRSFGSVGFRFLRKPRGKCSFWKSGLHLVKASWKTFVLEVWMISFSESLVENGGPEIFTESAQK